MSGESSSPAGWWSALEPTAADYFANPRGADDPRLADVVRRWDGGSVDLIAGQPVIIGFPCDEGVLRNGGRPGAAMAPERIQRHLYRLTSWDGLTGTDVATLAAVDMGNVRLGSVEEGQAALGRVVGAALRAKAIPIILGGGHETAYGHFLGYVAAGLDCAILNIDAHLDVRPYAQGGHSGSPFRQALEHTTRALGKARYVVLGAQRQNVARAHAEYMAQHHGRIHWFDPRQRPEEVIKMFQHEIRRLGDEGAAVMLTIDADAFRQADVPGVSAPSPVGFPGWLGLEMAHIAGREPAVRSLDVVEINPAFDRDDQAVRWAAQVIRQFIVGRAYPPSSVGSTA